MSNEKITRIITKGRLPDGRTICSYRHYPEGVSRTVASTILQSNRDAFATLSDTVFQYADGKEEQYVYSH